MIQKQSQDQKPEDSSTDKSHVGSGEVSWAHGFPRSLAKAFAPDLNEWLPTGYLAAIQVATSYFLTT